MLAAAKDRPLDDQVRQILTVLSVSAITEELVDRKRKGNYNVSTPKRSNTPPDIRLHTCDGGTPVHGEGDL